MLRATWRSLFARKLRLLLSAFAVVLGVAFVSGSYVFTDTLDRAFTGLTSGAVGAASSSTMWPSARNTTRSA